MSEVTTEILAFFSRVPDVVWSGLIASVLTLGGVLISNRSNTNRLLLQLKHDSDSKKNERQVSIRREIFLRFVENLTEFHFFISSLTKEDLADLPSDPAKKFQSSSSQILLVGTAETVRHISELTTLYITLFMKAMEKAAPACLEKSSISTKTALRERYNIEITRIISQMTALNESGEPNKVVFDALSVSYDGQCRLRDALSEEISTHWEKHDAMCAAYAEFIISESRKILSTQAKAIASLRNELDFELDENELLILLERQYSILQSHGEELLVNLRKLG